MPEPDELDDLLDRELPRLPMLSAPQRLAPRVMAAIRAKAAAVTAPWWLQSWLAWPLYARAGLFAAALLIASIFFSGGVLLDDQVSRYASQNPLANLLGDFAAIGNAIALLWQKIGQPLFLTRIVVCVALYSVCVGLGTAMFRVATREKVQ
jgi:hypothetical protein